MSAGADKHAEGGNRRAAASTWTETPAPLEWLQPCILSGGTGRVHCLPIHYPVWMLPAWPLLQCVETIAAAGFDGVAFGAAPVDDPRRIDRLQGREAAELRSYLHDLGLGRSVHVMSDCYFAGMAERQEDVVAQAKEGIERAVRALAGEELPPLIVSHDPICLPPGPTGVPAPELLVEMVQFLVTLSARYNITPALEDWPKPEFGTPEAMRALLQDAGGEVGILLDTGHLHLALKSDWCTHTGHESFVQALPAPVVEVHLHDNHGRTDEHLPPGKGTATLAGILATLVAGGFGGPVTLECDLASGKSGGLAEGLERARRLCESAPGRRPSR